MYPAPTVPDSPDMLRALELLTHYINGVVAYAELIEALAAMDPRVVLSLPEMPPTQPSRSGLRESVVAFQRVMRGGPTTHFTGNF